MKYSNCEKLINFLIKNKDQYHSKTKIMNHFKLSNEEKVEAAALIKRLLKLKILLKNNKKKIRLNSSYKLFIGNFFYNPKGYGFVVNKSEADNVFIPKDRINEAFHLDRVLCVVKENPDAGKRDEGEIIYVLSRETTTLVGTYIDNVEFGFVIPDNNRFFKDIYIPEHQKLSAQSYDKVVAKITKFPYKNRKPEGSIVEILGFKDDKGVDALSIIKDFNIKNSFNPKVLRQIEKLPNNIDSKEFSRRKDFTNLNVFTIDGIDSKDLDDAIHILLLDDGNYELGVHIADVSHYVQENSKLDIEALDRGTSVYLIDTVVPMLPTKLSNDLCSLNPNTNKLTLSVTMKVNKQGEVLDAKIEESIISSKAKLNYEEVTDYLKTNNKKFSFKYPDIAKDLKIMEELALVLQRKRDKRGAIEFDFPEAKIKLNENGNVISVDKYERGISNEIIEEFMLLTNETVSSLFKTLKIPFVYRTHEKPRMDRLLEFTNFINQYGYSCIINSEEDVCSKKMQQILAEAKNKPEETAFNLMLLKSMQQARYSPNCIGHFGLAADYYCHFTSPIRRYPDLQIHRIIKDYINSKLSLTRISDLEDIVLNVSKLSSKKERIAERAEKDYYDIKKIEFMIDKIGQEFDATIININNSGVFVALDNTIEGFIKIESLTDDVYNFDKDLYRLIGKNSGDIIQIGNRIKVRLSKVNPEIKTIIFDIIK